MFFEKESLSFRILDVLYLDQKNTSSVNTGRNFHALSYRFHSDARIQTPRGCVDMQDTALAYFPARLDYSRTATVDEMIVVHFDTGDRGGKELEWLLPEDPATMGTLFRQLYTLWVQKAPGYRHRASALFCEILALCHTQRYVPKTRGSKIQASVEYLQRNFLRPDLTLEEVAKQSYMSQVYFRRLFKEEFGTSPKKYILELRIRHAVGLISAGYYSLGEVAELCGYRDYKYFSVEFKRLMGVSPSEYSYNYE